MLVDKLTNCGAQERVTRDEGCKLSLYGEYGEL